MKTTLSKSKYIAGLQCPRRLWLGCHAPDLGTPATARLAAVLDQGAEIGRRARDLFADGVLVDQEAWEHGQATARTRAGTSGSSAAVSALTSARQKNRCQSMPSSPRT